MHLLKPKQGFYVVLLRLAAPVSPMNDGPRVLVLVPKLAVWPAVTTSSVDQLVSLFRDHCKSPFRVFRNILAHNLLGAVILYPLNQLFHMLYLVHDGFSRCQRFIY